jgi:ferric-dicitrate binding protein FerR (iron transport regulator)
VNWDTLLKYVNHECDLAEKREVEYWLDEQKEHQYLLDHLQKRRDQLQQPLKQTDIHDQWVRLLDRIFETPKIGPSSFLNGYWFIGIAASLLMVSFFGWLYITNKPNPVVQTITLRTPGDRRGHITLPDGSEIYMAPDSKITYNTAFGKDRRELNLTGEAFFNVKHNAHSPFIVHALGNLSVTVLGTSFNVFSRKDNNTEVKVATGLVGVTANHQTCFLKAGQQLGYQQDKTLNVNLVDNKEVTALKNEALYFKNDNAHEIAQKLQRWYNVNFEVSSKADRHPRFSGEMKDAGLDNVLKALGYAIGLKYKYKNRHTILLY